MSMALSFSCNASFRSQHQFPNFLIQNFSSRKDLDPVRNLVKSTGIDSFTSSPIESLRSGKWVKLICGASFEDLADIRNLSLVYTLAGVDCIDCAADASVVSAVNEGIQAARGIINVNRPWVMISINDDQDLHFRKAEFDPEDCPLDCSRPCENVCPANAIKILEENSISYDAFSSGLSKGGVITERCYGCGRCFPVCPYDKINAFDLRNLVKIGTEQVMYMRDAADSAELLKRKDVDAVEIHTSARQTAYFKQLWDNLSDSTRSLKLVAISLPSVGDSTLSTMKAMYSIMEPQLNCFNLWQLDGRPMSGDIGRGTTREAIAFARRLTSLKDRPPGFLQLAGGTNFHTVEGLKKEGLFQSMSISKMSEDEEFPAISPVQSNALIGGVAYGGYARKIIGRILSSIELTGVAGIEDYPNHLFDALREALTLVDTVKCYDNFQAKQTDFLL